MLRYGEYQLVPTLASFLKLEAFLQLLIAETLPLMIAEVELVGTALVDTFLGLLSQEFQMLHLFLEGNIQETESVTEDMLFY